MLKKKKSWENKHVLNHLLNCEGVSLHSSENLSIILGLINAEAKHLEGRVAYPMLLRKL